MPAGHGLAEKLTRSSVPYCSPHELRASRAQLFARAVDTVQHNAVHGTAVQGLWASLFHGHEPCVRAGYPSAVLGIPRLIATASAGPSFPFPPPNQSPSFHPPSEADSHTRDHSSAYSLDQPSHVLGTGVERMPERSPQLLRMLSVRLATLGELIQIQTMDPARREL
jgi:hypothetical protein